MRWPSVFIYLSAIALIGAVVSQLVAWPDGRAWFLLFWTVLLLATVIGLFAHPMRGPAWGLFIGFWGAAATVLLIVVQVLAVWGVLEGSAYTEWAAWPLAVIAIWILLASLTGFGAEPFGPLVDGLGVLTGAALLAISVSTWAGMPEVMRIAGLAAAVGYCLWSLPLGWVVWNLRPITRSTVPSLAHRTG